MNHYPRHIGDIAKDTAHLSQGQFGAYDLLLDWYYAHEKPLPLDKAFLYAITRARDRAEKASTDAVLNWFFVQEADGWHQKRCDEELAKYQEKSGKAAKSASIRWGKTNSEGNANASKTHDESQSIGNASHKPVTSNQEPEVKSSGVARAAHRPAAKASRLPADWLLPRPWGEWAMQEQPTWTADHTRKVSDSFRDYWIAKSGKDATKTDWEATWRNWVRKEKPMTTGVAINGKSHANIHDERAATIAALTGGAATGRTFDVTPEPVRP